MTYSRILEKIQNRVYQGLAKVNPKDSEEEAGNRVLTAFRMDCWRYLESELNFSIADKEWMVIWEFVWRYHEVNLSYQDDSDTKDLTSALSFLSAMEPLIVALKEGGHGQEASL